jgi:hypothetical protein
MAQQEKRTHKINNGETKLIEDVQPDAYLMCEKQRNGEHEEWYQLWYHKDSQQFVEDEQSLYQWHSIR